MRVCCTGIVHYPDGVVLIRDEAKAQWRLPERELDDAEDILLCIRRCVLLQTGYRAAKIRFYKIQTQARTHKGGAFIRFIFGCEIAGEPLQAPQGEARHFTPDDVIRLADKGGFNDPVLLKLIHKYRETIAYPEPPASPL